MKKLLLLLLMLIVVTLTTSAQRNGVNITVQSLTDVLTRNQPIGTHITLLDSARTYILKVAQTSGTSLADIIVANECEEVVNLSKADEKYFNKDSTVNYTDVVYSKAYIDSILVVLRAEIAAGDIVKFNATTHQLYVEELDSTWYYNADDSAEVIPPIFETNMFVYEFEENGLTLTDHGLNGLDATNEESVTVTTGHPGNGYTYVFGGLEYSTHADDAVLDFTGAFTISAWINIASFTGNRMILSKSDGTNREFAFEVGNDGSLRFRAYENNTTSFTEGRTAAGLISLSTDYLVTVKMDASDRLRTGLEFYINNSPVAVATWNGDFDLVNGIIDTAAPLYVARQTAPSNVYFNGVISQISAWSQETTTDMDNTVYNSGNGAHSNTW